LAESSTVQIRTVQARPPLALIHTEICPVKVRAAEIGPLQVSVVEVYVS
jgi:hypothetical protein